MISGLYHPAIIFMAPYLIISINCNLIYMIEEDSIMLVMLNNQSNGECTDFNAHQKYFPLLSGSFSRRRNVKNPSAPEKRRSYGRIEQKTESFLSPMKYVIGQPAIHSGRSYSSHMGLYSEDVRCVCVCVCVWTNRAEMG